MEAVCVPAHLAPSESLQAKQLCHLHTQLSLGQSCHRQKNLASMHAGSLRSCLTLSDPIDCGLPVFSVREGSSTARILQHIGQCWFPYPSRAPYSLLAQPPAPLNTCQNPCDPNSCTTSTPGPPRGRPESSRAASGANPSGQLTCRGGNKATTETQGQCG